MSRARHKGKKAEGGRIGLVASGNPDVLKEAEGKEPYSRKHGGKAKSHRMHGGHVKHRMDKPRPGRKSGGGVGADRTPLSTAHRAHKGESNEGSSPEDTYGGTPHN